MSGKGKQTLRLDKILSHMGVGTRSELKKMVKQGRIHVDGKAVKDSGVQVNPEVNVIEADGERIEYREMIYLMLHKPPGVVSATEDNRDKTVLDLLRKEDRVFNPFPVGRLDKDTEGLLILTNDGPLAHDLLSPRKHVPKTYEARVLGNVDEADVQRFKAGIQLDDGYETLPAELTILGQEETEEDTISSISLIIHEGKFHQVKRMFQAVGKRVIYLKRVAMGELELASDLAIGSYRELTADELSLLRK
ncbi:16S rRNA pseudouridine516 synthase [Paenibacillus xylanexedens]|uniref:pseudouridine synthase n=1 Tax=Paenibacillus xylanexedens TaxID=528191 RepID=UPI0020A004AF|nr:pseudouridine synthase [Paenibacillus xylanexedens]MCP1425961.1 16S rRNA pseudouridine516 synthase [Paenibacillus xylanexedens]